MVLVAAGALLQARLGPGAHPAAFVPGALAVGVGMGLFTAPNNSAIMSAAPGARRGVAGAILGAARTTGFASGTALIAAIYAMRLHALAGRAPGEAVAGAVRGGLVVIAGICLAAAALSALRDA
jgi:hypothetical protein